MKQKVVHETGIPMEGESAAYEYTLPLLDIPSEVDERWSDWLDGYRGLDQQEVRKSIENQYAPKNEALQSLHRAILNFNPFSILVFSGTPHFWMENGEDRIYLAPPIPRHESSVALEPYDLASCQVLVDFLMLFGGMGDRYPWEEIEFFGKRSEGHVIVEPSLEVFDAGSEYRSAAENRERHSRFAPWMKGIQILNGGDGKYWLLGEDHTVCEHTCGDDEIAGTFKDFSELLACFVDASEESCLFAGGYNGIAHSR